MKTLKIIAIISGCLTLGQFAYLIMFGGSAGSIGIISSSDGPTVTFYSSVNPVIQYGFLAISALITITVMILIAKKKSQ